MYSERTETRGASKDMAIAMRPDCLRQISLSADGCLQKANQSYGMSENV